MAMCRQSRGVQLFFSILVHAESSRLLLSAVVSSLIAVETNNNNNNNINIRRHDYNQTVAFTKTIAIAKPIYLRLVDLHFREGLDYTSPHHGRLAKSAQRHSRLVVELHPCTLPRARARSVLAVFRTWLLIIQSEYVVTIVSDS